MGTEGGRRRRSLRGGRRVGEPLLVRGRRRGLEAEVAAKNEKKKRDKASADSADKGDGLVSKFLKVPSRQPSTVEAVSKVAAAEKADGTSGGKTLLGDEKSLNAGAQGVSE